MRGGKLIDVSEGSVEQIASDGLKGRVFEVSLADLQQDEDQAYRKIKLRAEDVQGKNVLTNFWVCTVLALHHCDVFRVLRPLRDIS